MARKPLPFPAPFDSMWTAINTIIDSLHIRNHKDAKCKEKYNPAKLKEQLPNMNTMAAEQTFVWLSRFKKILCSMPKVHHLFFMHRMVVRRNSYTVSCYRRGLKLVLPKARSAQSKWFADRLFLFFVFFFKSSHLFSFFKFNFNF